ncbi:hypothetical protein AAHA92_10601 [Salvia divinorum]|uniref:Uncharacterized protein n=1 Tax=Salvia divinorum TaxID=28513 RepID=A0ABD1HXS5_SALDI
MQANNDVVHKLQDAHQEQKAAMDMLAKQLSQIATSLSEMRGNKGKIPATVKMPIKENISQITLRSGRAYQGPTRKADNEVPGVGDEEGDRLIKQTGRAMQKDELQLGDLGKPLPQMADPFFLDPEPEVETEEKEETKENEGGAPNEVPSSAVKQTKSFPYRG